VLEDRPARRRGSPTTTTTTTTTSTCDVGPICLPIWTSRNRPQAPLPADGPCRDHRESGRGNRTSSGGTSTKVVFTGQTVSNNGGPSARTTAKVTVPGPSIAGSYAMTLTTKGGTVHDYSLTMNSNGSWSITGGTGTNGIVARGILARDAATSVWALTQTAPAANSHFTATSSNGTLKGSWFTSGGAGLSGRTHALSVGVMGATRPSPENSRSATLTEFGSLRAGNGPKAGRTNFRGLS
jgi:hypothetical protein